MTNNEQLSHRTISETAEQLKNYIAELGGAEHLESLQLDALDSKWRKTPQYNLACAVWDLPKRDRMKIWKDIGRFRKLKCISLSHDGKCPVDDEEWTFILRGSKTSQLESIFVQGAKNLTDDAFQNLGCGQSLRRLTLSSSCMKNITDDAFQHLFSGCKNSKLEHLELLGMKHLTDQCFEYLAESNCGASLKTLIIDSGKCISDIFSFLAVCLCVMIEVVVANLRLRVEMS